MLFQEKLLGWILSSLSTVHPFTVELLVGFYQGSPCLWRPVPFGGWDAQWGMRRREESEWQHLLLGLAPPWEAVSSLLTSQQKPACVREVASVTSDSS